MYVHSVTCSAIEKHSMELESRRLKLRGLGDGFGLRELGSASFFECGEASRSALDGAAWCARHHSSASICTTLDEISTKLSFFSFFLFLLPTSFSSFPPFSHVVGAAGVNDRSQSETLVCPDEMDISRRPGISSRENAFCSKSHTTISRWPRKTACCVKVVPLFPGRVSEAPLETSQLVQL